MRKIPTLFRRDPEDRRRVLPEVDPECRWVLDGEGVATRKYDGTCLLRDTDGTWWARCGNPEGVRGHTLVAHADAEPLDAPRDADGLREWLLAHPAYEGIVWHHPDGRRAKLKRRDVA
ncbi:hypothetical protein [Micromonospora sp. NBS 11-29]|uniref:hypothetical protein n=1 Tax=Micromonospora sp. NBS 11-29 TaxID=1960879 RepID=UPI000B7725B4|nr:hypothetical protein [Micromonospora sp. NBS 11-29]